MGDDPASPLITGPGICPRLIQGPSGDAQGDGRMAQPVQGKEPPQTPMGFLPLSEDEGGILLRDETPLACRWPIRAPRSPGRSGRGSGRIAWDICGKGDQGLGRIFRSAGEEQEALASFPFGILEQKTREQCPVRL